MMGNARPVEIEKITISPKRHISVKLWPATPHPQWGMSRASIELQEVRYDEKKQPSYGNPLRFPCDSATALVTDIMKNFLLKGRELNKELQEKQKNSSMHAELTQPESSQRVDLESLLLHEFANQKLSKTRIHTKLTETGQDVEKSLLYQTLDDLAEQGKISKKKAIHSALNTEYDLWVFPQKTVV